MQSGTGGVVGQRVNDRREDVESRERKLRKREERREEEEVVNRQVPVESCDLSNPDCDCSVALQKHGLYSVQ